MVRTGNLVAAHKSVAPESEIVKSSGATRANPVVTTKASSLKLDDLKKRFALATTKKRRYRPGTVALREIRKAQRGTGFQVAKLKFARLVREIVQSVTPNDMNFQAGVIEALQTTAENYLVEQLRAANYVACKSRNCVTVTPSDMRTVKAVQSIMNDGDMLT